MIAIQAEQLTKRYPLDCHPTAKLRYALHPRPSYPSFTAVDGVSFSLDAGDTLGVLGVNGAGKSTLLKMLAGVTTPTSGTLNVNGRVGALLELGAGFNLEYTGIENARLALLLAGIPKKKAEDYLDDILNFADIGDFVKMPVKTYSSGMFVRLAFAAATATRPDVLLVDEALSVGDLFFQAKCVRRMKDMLSSGSALVFVSHDIGAVKSVCRQCLLLNNGKADMLGATEDVARRYFTLKVAAEQPSAVKQEDDTYKVNAVQEVQILPDKALLDKRAACEASDEIVPPHEKEPGTRTVVDVLPRDESWLRRTAQNRFGDGRARFENVRLLDENGRPLDNPAFAQAALLRMQIISKVDLNELCVGYHIQSGAGVDVVYSDTAVECCNLTSLKAGQRYVVEWRFRLALGEGAHNIAVVCSVPVDIASSQVEFCDYVHCAAQFDMQRRQQAKIYALSYWPNEVRTMNLSNADLREVTKS